MDLQIREHLILQNIKFVIEDTKTFIVHNDETIMIIHNDDYWIEEVCPGLFRLVEVFF